MAQFNVSGVKALIFDMDGVIVDSEPFHLLAYQEFFQPFAVHYTEEDNREFLGCKDLSMAAILIKRFKLPHTPESMVRCKEQILCRLLKDNSRPRPGLYEVLKEARSLDLPMAVASSATLATIELVVDTLCIRDYFATLTSGDEVSHGKPAPDIFLLAAGRLAVESGYCLVVEDTLNGIRAAKAAGMHCVAIPCEATRHQDHSLADFSLASLEQLDLRALTQATRV